MKNKIFYSVAAASLLALGACSEENISLSGEGAVALNATINADTKLVGSRALEDDLGPSLLMWISQVNGDKSTVIREYKGLDNVPSQIPLLSGNYVAEAWAGDSVSASWTARYFKGFTPFAITKGVVTPVEVVCKISNVVVSVQYDANVDDVLKDYTLTVGHSRGNLTFDGSEGQEKAYFMMPKADTDLSWTLTGIKKDDGITTFSRTSKILSVQPGHEYIFKISCEQSSEDIGGGMLNIVIDDTVIDAEESITIAAAPIIQGYLFDINQPLHCEPGQVGHRSVYVSASAALSSVVITGDDLQNVFGAGAVDFDAITMQPSVQQKLADAGIDVQYMYDSVLDASTLKFTLNEEFSDTYLITEGEHTFNFKATDAEGRVSEKTLVIMVSDVPYVPDPITIVGPKNAADVWATKAIIYGQISHPEILADGYAITVDCNGQTFPATLVDENTFKVELTGLVDGNKYKFDCTASVEKADGSTFVTPVYTLVTEERTQLPNAGFENWQTSSTPYLVYGAGESMWWDSGNHGSAKMNKNVTIPESSIKHSGNYSIKLASQFVGIGSIGAFAAGNVFCGEFIGTEQTSHGILGWGRSFTTRPTKLKGWAKYSPVNITHVGSNAPSEYAKGDPDKGIIYIALMDDHTETYSGKEYPVIIRTSVPQLFDKNSEHVIAYGELIWNEATAGDGLIEFEVPIVYNRTDIKPSYIVLTASASKGGDYFTGGNGSNLYLDDLELVYE